MTQEQLNNFQPQDRVQHIKFGIGTVEYDKGLTVLVRFEHGIEECERDSLSKRYTLNQALEQEKWSDPLSVITRVQAESIVSESPFAVE